MGQLNRRQMLRGSAALGAGTALGGAGALLERARAWAGEMPFQPEPGARLRVLRWTPFVAAESAVSSTTRRVQRGDRDRGPTSTASSSSDIEPKAAVAANVGAGPDLVWGLDMTPHLFPEQLIDLSEVARHLGERYGGWYRSPRPTAGTAPAGGSACPPASTATPSATGRAGSRMPASSVSRRLPTTSSSSARSSTRLGHPGGFALGHASADANAWVHWLIWAFGGRLVDAERPGRDQQQGDDRRARVCPRALPHLLARHRDLDRQRQRQGLPRRRDRLHQRRRRDLRRRAERGPGRDRRGHELRPLPDRPGRRADRAAGRRSRWFAFALLAPTRTPARRCSRS